MPKAQWDELVYCIDLIDTERDLLTGKGECGDGGRYVLSGVPCQPPTPQNFKDIISLGVPIQPPEE